MSPELPLPNLAPFAQRGLIRIDAAAILDAHHVQATPGSLLVQFDPIAPGTHRIGRRDVPRGRLEVLAAGTPAEVDQHPIATRAQVVALPGHLLIPALVNAHTHLDLTRIGPRPFDPAAGFAGWIDMVRRERPVADPDIRAAVEDGLRLSLLGGVAAVGDIAGAPGGVPQLGPFRALAESPVAGVSFVEFFAIGRGEAAGLARLEGTLAGVERCSTGNTRLGLQPHAPNTVSIRGYERALELARAWPLSTHVAETLEERAFVGRGEGPQRDFLERLGLWEDRILEDVGRGRTPVGHLAGVLGRSQFAAVHVNDASDEDIGILKGSGAVVVYCPRASEYFGAAGVFGPHRYREMMAAGVPVALGTDSVINLPLECAAADGPGISTWGEMVLLHTRDGTPSRELLGMATTAGARALGMDAGLVTLSAGSRPLGVLAVGAVGGGEGDVLGRALAGGAGVEFLSLGN